MNNICEAPRKMQSENCVFINIVGMKTYPSPWTSPFTRHPPLTRI